MDLSSESKVDLPSEEQENAVGGYSRTGADPTLMQTLYEACNQNLIQDRVKSGTVLRSESVFYQVVKAIHTSNNLFEVVDFETQTKYLVRIFDCDEIQKFQNEFEKLDLLNSVMEDMGVSEQGFVVKMIESFTCEVNQKI